MTQKELTKICKKCKINDPDECVECEYMKRVTANEVEEKGKS